MAWAKQRSAAEIQAELDERIAASGVTIATAHQLVDHAMGGLVGKVQVTIEGIEGATVGSPDAHNRVVYILEPNVSKSSGSTGWCFLHKFAIPVNGWEMSWSHTGTISGTSKKASRPRATARWHAANILKLLKELAKAENADTDANPEPEDEPDEF